MKINLISKISLLSILFLTLDVHAGGFFSKAEPEVYFKDSLLGKLPIQIANYIWLLAEYQHMLDTTQDIADFSNAKKIWLVSKNIQCSVLCEELHGTKNPKHCSLYEERVYKSKIENFLANIGIVSSVNYIKSFFLGNKYVALSSNGSHVCFLDDYQNLSIANLEKFAKMPFICPKYKYCVQPEIPIPKNLILLNYLDGSKKIVLIYKNDAGQEETAFYKLGDFDESYKVDENVNLLENFVTKKK